MYVPKWLIAVGLGGWLLLGLQTVMVPKTKVDVEMQRLKDEIKRLQDGQSQPQEPAPAQTPPTAPAR
jgi:hypothetical protein